MGQPGRRERARNYAQYAQYDREKRQIWGMRSGKSETRPPSQTGTETETGTAAIARGLRKEIIKKTSMDKGSRGGGRGGHLCAMLLLYVQYIAVILHLWHGMYSK